MKLRTHTMDSALVLLLFTAFAASVLAVLVFGTRAYISVNDSANDGYDLRTCLSYVETKVRQSPSPRSISVGAIDGNSALLIDQDVDGRTYETALYASGGKMRELFAEKSLGLGAEDGTDLLSVDRLSFADAGDGMLSVECEDDSGAVRSLLIYIPGWGGDNR